MSSEANVNLKIYIRNEPLIYSNPVEYMRYDVLGKAGPSPGSLIIPTTGVNIDLTQIVNPATIYMLNYDLNNYVEFGLWDGIFMPIGILRPGRFNFWELSPNLGLAYGTGTGTEAGSMQFRLKAHLAACNVRVDVLPL